MDTNRLFTSSMSHSEWLEIGLFAILSTLALILLSQFRRRMQHGSPPGRKAHLSVIKAGWRAIPEIQLLALGLPLELLWETAQFPLYTIWHQGRWGEILYGLVHCTLGDLLILLIAYWMIALLNRDRRWPLHTGLQNGVLFTALGAVYTVYSEIMNVHIKGTWDYTELMPIVPYLGIGGTPFLQWLLIPPVLLWFMRLTTPCSAEY